MQRVTESVQRASPWSPLRPLHTFEPTGLSQEDGECWRRVRSSVAYGLLNMFIIVDFAKIFVLVAAG